MITKVLVKWLWFSFTRAPCHIHYSMRHIFITQYMMTSSNGNIFRVTGHLCGEFTGPGEFPTQRPVTRSFDVYFDLRPNKRLSKQSLGWWFETLSPPLWRHRNELGRKLADVPCGKSITITIEWTLFLSNIYMQGTNTRIMFGFIYVTYVNTE